MQPPGYSIYFQILNVIYCLGTIQKDFSLFAICRYVIILYRTQQHEWKPQDIKSCKFYRGGMRMVLRRVMTGLVAATVCLFSVSVFGVLWKINEHVRTIEFAVDSDAFVWEGKYHGAEIEMKDGMFERFVFYRKSCDCRNT